MGKRNPNVCRVVKFQPYVKGKGPTFTLTLTDNHGWDEAGRNRIGYTLKMHDAGKTTIIFDGADICSHAASDSDDMVKDVMGWLTLKPGDTDAEFFADDNDTVKAYREHHAEWLESAVDCRFGERE